MSEANRIIQRLEEIQKRVDRVQETLSTARQLITEHFEKTNSFGG